MKYICVMVLQINIIEQLIFYCVILCNIVIKIYIYIISRFIYRFTYSSTGNHSSNTPISATWRMSNTLYRQPENDWDDGQDRMSTTTSVATAPKGVNHFVCYIEIATTWLITIAAVINISFVERMYVCVCMCVIILNKTKLANRITASVAWCCRGFNERLNQVD